MGEVKNDVLGIALVTAGLLIYGWFAAKLNRSILPAEGWFALLYLLIAFGLLVVVWRSVRQRRILYNFALLGGCMFLVSLFTSTVYCSIYDIRVSGLLIEPMEKLLEINAPIAPFVWLLFVGGIALILLNAVYGMLREML